MLQAPPSAVVLFNGEDVDNWKQRDGSPATWETADGAMTTCDADILTEEKFTDFMLHLQFMIPDMPEATGQAKGNSGVFLQGRYEIQVLDSYGIEVPGKGDCGAIYDQHASLVNACKLPLQWQAYDVLFRAPRVDDSGNQLEAPRVTVLQNGLVIQNNVHILRTSAGAVDENIAEPGPLLLQHHGDEVRYRDVWIVPLPLKGSDVY
jgi:hypothetical protein